MKQQPNRKREKSLATQEALMDAAETLIAAKGPHYVTIKDIVKAANQKNPSVLQYHFKTMDGLLEALHLRRIAQTRLYRSKLLERTLIAKGKLELRDLCELMIRPALELANKDKQYRAYAAAFGHEIAITGDSAFEVVSRTGGGGGSGFVIGKLLRNALPMLDETTFRARMDLAVRMCSAAVSHHVRQKKPLRGKRAEFFTNTLIDALVGVLSAAPSNNGNPK